MKNKTEGFINSGVRDKSSNGFYERSRKEVKGTTPLVDTKAALESESAEVSQLTDTGSKPKDPLIGKTLSRYTIVKEIGHGGMGIVYLGEDKNNPQAPKVAIKVLAEKIGPYNEEMRARFFKEVTAILKLNHPNIVEGIGLGEFEGQLYLIMEYVEGVDLNKLLRKKKGQLTLGEIINIIVQVCDGMQAAHERGIIHRDLKLENIIVLEDGRVKIVDLGLAKFFNLPYTAAEKVTRTGTVLGTPEYMAPELIRGEEYDHRIDIYALGIILYYAISGSFPFTATTPIAIFMKHATEIPQPPSKLSHSVPPEFDAIVMRALAKKPEERFQTMAEFKNALLEAAKKLNLDVVLPFHRIDETEEPLEEKQPDRLMHKLRKILGSGIFAATFFVASASFSIFTFMRLHSEQETAQQKTEQEVAQQKTEQTSDITQPSNTSDEVYQLKIETIPSGALVKSVEEREDGLQWFREIGETPVLTQLKGKRLLVVESDGYFPMYLEVYPGNSEFLGLTLKKMPEPEKK